jgi:hypothetical protein
LIGIATGETGVFALMFVAFVAVYIGMNFWALVSAVTLRVASSLSMRRAGTVAMGLAAALNVYVATTLGIKDKLRETPQERQGRALSQALWKNDVSAVETLLKKGAQPNVPVDRWSPLGVAIRASPRSVPVLLARGARVDQPANEYGDTPLAVAAWAGQPEIIRLLLDNRARVDVRNRDGQTALMRAARATKSSQETIEALLNAGAYIEAIDTRGYTPLAVAVQEGNTVAVRVLLQRGAKTDVITSDGHTLLQLVEIGSKINEFRGAEFANHYREIAGLLKAIRSSS